MSQVDDETKRLMDSIFIEKVMRARQRSIGEKLLDGPRLFEQGCQIMRGGIRSQFPDFTAEQVEAEFRRRLAIGRRIAEAGIYQNVGVLDE
jgi:hypothetical protein